MYQLNETLHYEHGVTPALVAPLRNLSRIGQQLDPILTFSTLSMDAGEQAKIVRHTQPGAGLAKLLQGRIVSREPLSDSACFCDRPGPHKRAPRSVVVEPVFLAQAARFLRRFESPLWLTPELMEHGQVSQCKRDTERVRDFASKRQRFLGCFQSAIRIAEMPVAVADVGMAEDAHVDAVQFGVVAAGGVVRFQASLKPITGCLEGAEVKCRDSGEVISLHEQRRLSGSTGQTHRC